MQLSCIPNLFVEATTKQRIEEYQADTVQRDFCLDAEEMMVRGRKRVRERGREKERLVG
jgi:hypothetical protein